MINIDKYTSSNILKAYQEKKNVILPIGAIEAHGAHLPLGCDNIILDFYTKQIALKSNSLLLPTLSYGQVYSLENAAGSISIQEDNLTNFILDIIKSLEKDHVKMLTLITTHFGNINTLKKVSRKAYELYKIKVIYLNYPNLNKNKKIFENLPNHSLFLHAGEVETSLMLYINKELVDKTKYVKGIINLPSSIDYTPLRWTEFTSDYIIGDPSLSTSSKGEIFINNCIDEVVRIINEEMSIINDLE